MRISILTAVNTLYEGNVKEAILPGKDGEISVLDFHQPFLVCLREGDICIKERWLNKPGKTQRDKPELRVAIKEGVAKMMANELTALVEV